MKPHATTQRKRAMLEILGGLALFAIGFVLSYVTYGHPVQQGGGRFLVMTGPMGGGLLLAIHGWFRLDASSTRPDAPPRTLRQRVLGGLLTGGMFVLVSAAVAVLGARSSWWGLGLFSVAVLAQAIGILRIGSALLELVPVRLGSAIAMMVAGLTGIVATFLLDDTTIVGGLPASSPLFALHPLAIVSLGLVTEGISRARAALTPESGGLLLPLVGFKSFVAWRYLLVFENKVTFAARLAPFVAATLGLIIALDARDDIGLPPSISAILAAATFGIVTWAGGILRHSRPGYWVFVIGVMLSLGAIVGLDIVRSGHVPRGPFEDPLDPTTQALLQTFDILKIAGAVLAGLALFFGTLRTFFTFFTTVPIGGVWIGTAALVMVLAVMSGFETDLREKILGSNAHIQITREDGEFTDWREVKARIDKIPGVVASTPYAVSEVVIAAHNNGMNVIIKGIDPETVGKVTDLVSDLEDPDAMRRLEPLADDTWDLTVPEGPRPTDTIDPPPDDLPVGGDPIDFSGDSEPPAAYEPTPSGPPDRGAMHLEPPVDFGGDALDIVKTAPDPPPVEVVDPPPPDLVTSDKAPIDFSGPATPDDGDRPRIGAVDIPIEPTLSRRTQALPGILVGRELVKQTHLYTGEEVRVVSPLSDPSNPDATGTPIPFNRDYRVAGIFFTGMYEYDLKYVYVTLDSLQDFLDRGDAVDGIEVRVRDPDDTGAYVPTSSGAGLIRQALGPGYRVVDWRELNRSLFSALKLEKIAMFLVLGIVILVASFSIVGNLIMVVVEKGREIALLKTLGAADLSVTQLFAIQGLMIGLIGTVLGVVTGLVACYLGKRYGLPLDPNVYYIDRLPIHVDYESVLAAAAAGIGISIVATLYPAVMAARVRPAAGMRH